MNHCCSLETIFITSESYDFLRSCKEIETDIIYMWCSQRCGGNTSGAMEEIYANVQYAKPVDPSPSTNHTGKNVQLDRDIVQGCVYRYRYRYRHHQHTVDRIHWSFVCSGPRSSERRFHGYVVLCLGLLSVSLLAGLIGLGVTCESGFPHQVELLDFPFWIFT